MENNIDLEVAQMEYLEVKTKLWDKLCTFGICLAVFFVFFKLVDNEASFFSILKDAFYFTLVMYLPFKICYQSTGSIISSLIGSFILVIIVGLVIGENSLLLACILLGGLILDFGWSIRRLTTLKKTLSSYGQ